MVGLGCVWIRSMPLPHADIYTHTYRWTSPSWGRTAPHTLIYTHIYIHTHTDDGITHTHTHLIYIHTYRCTSPSWGRTASRTWSRPCPSSSPGSCSGGCRPATGGCISRCVVCVHKLMMGPSKGRGAPPGDDSVRGCTSRCVRIVYSPRQPPDDSVDGSAPSDEQE